MARKARNLSSRDVQYLVEDLTLRLANNFLIFSEVC